MRIAHHLGCALLIVVFAGCSRFAIDSKHDPSASFAGLHTYDWRMRERTDLGDPRIDSARLESSVRGAVDRELATKGFVKATSAPPDFLVDYYAGKATRGDSVSMPRWYGSAGTVGWSESFSSRYDEGTLLVYALDPTTMKPIWIGRAKGVIDPTASLEKRGQRVDRVVQGILKKFPPR